MEAPETPAFHFFPLTRKLWHFGALKTENLFLTVGLATENTIQFIRFVRDRQFSLKHFMEQASFIGVDSLGIAMVMVTFSGMVISLQVSKEMAKQGAGQYIGSLVSLAILRELAPVMTGLAVVAMAGSAFAAELATMQITKQIDALRVLHVHPIRYLVMPRVLAAMFTLPLMTVLTAFSGIMGGMVVSFLLADIHPGSYLDSVWYQTEMKDIFASLLKSTVFGFLIALLSTTIGLSTSGGAKEVGLATTRAVVWSFIACAIMDYLLTYFIYGSK
ncbi:MAG: ABC transporter permease [Cyanobacteria bacterium]|nr:ABC transporter permease [Cyanobacteriota bacterium]